MSISRNNNFDLIRLMAAFQVLFWHGAEHLKVFDKVYYFLVVLFQFPGVPIFFTISGFLISYSLERNNFNLKKYFKNRALRIFPALWLCTIITAFLLIGLSQVTSIKDFFTWFFAQITFFQFYVSPSLKSWGVGHPNGSLWSIAVELQFYLILPVVLYVISKAKQVRFSNIIILIIFALSIAIKLFILKSASIAQYQTLQKLLNTTVLVYLHFFLTGIAIYKNFDFLEKFLRNKILIWLIVYAIYVLVARVWFNLYLNPYDISVAGIIANTILSLLTISFAFSYTNLSQKLLHENDISYGMYIYHMPVINCMISFEIFGSMIDLLILIVFTTLLSYLSWKFVEQRILRLKM
jgi:peptidoglycan/LPS O-acetylase OafA/YrhL